MKNSTAHLGSTDDGFSLIELVVSMFILALLSLALIPLLIQGIKQSAQNATVATATQLVGDQLSSARIQAAPGFCSAITALASSNVVPSTGIPLTDSRGVRLRLSRTPGTCPTTTTSYPRTVKFTAKVVRVDTGATVVQADTLIFVAAP